MNEKYQRFSVSLPKDLLEDFDSVLNLVGMSRSDAIRKAMRDYITGIRWQLTPKEGIIVGSVTLILDHEQKQGIMDELNELEHHYLNVITASLHIHLDERNCMMVLTVRGAAEEILNLTMELQKKPEIKETKLTLISTGKKFE
jgi:CopG family nickel-responsive transcriptional regulator